MPIDPSIPLNAQSPQMDIGKLADLVAFGRKQKTQNALRDIMSKPEATDPATGLPKTEAIQQIMRIDPTTGLGLMQSNADIQQTIQKGKQEEAKIYQPLVKDAVDAMANILEPRIKQFGLEKAIDMSKSDYKEALKNLGARGVPPNILSQLSQELTPNVATWITAQSISPEKRADIAERKATGDRQDKTEAERERHDRETERLMGERIDAGAKAASQKGWSEFVDDKNTVYRENPNAGLTQKKVDGKWVDVDQLPANVRKAGTAEPIKFDAKAGELMAALAEQGVSLPTGFRSKEQQAALYKGILEKNPDLSADDIATKLKTGQIEFGAQKKETQTAAGVAGKVEVAENEINEFAPLVRESSKKVDRGKFVPINQLFQMADAKISDPNLKTLKIQINSLLNAYDMLAARGGTDVEKRKEVRSLLMAAESQEALEAGLKAFEQEAAAAHRAAVKATKVPELAGDKPKADKGAPVDHSKATDDELKKVLGIP